MAAGWSVSWTGHIEHREELNDEDEVRATEHIACYGAAVSHTLGQAGAAPNRLRVTVERTNGPDGETPTLIVEIRAHIPGMDQAVFESVARRAETSCPVWASLPTELDVRLVAVLEDEQATATPQPHHAKREAKPSAEPAKTSAAPHNLSSASFMSSPSLPRPAFAARAIAPSRPSWLTPKMGLAAVGMLVLALRVALMLGS
jgi:organic hydroperoxide reductase OsmC/OhrA